MGVAHSLFLQSNGTVLGCGNLSHGQLGFDPLTLKNKDLLKAFSLFKVPIPGHSPIKLIASNYFHCIAVSAKQIFIWGENPQTLKMKTFLLKRLRAQTKAKSTENEDSAENKKPEEMSRDYMKVRKLCDWSGPEICQISAGFNHSAFITSNGQLYVFGKNLEMQLGLGHKKDRDEPTLIQTESTKDLQWAKVNCGKF